MLKIHLYNVLENIEKYLKIYQLGSFVDMPICHSFCEDVRLCQMVF